MIEEGDRALCFTQFAEFGHLLASTCRAGSTARCCSCTAAPPAAPATRWSPGSRTADGPPIFLLSLKAGGTGLNLTRATHVFHFDRWWNPAVEDQATDRAFRIGQDRNVQVHKYICAGTLEERIDALISASRRSPSRSSAPARPG